MKLLLLVILGFIALAAITLALILYLIRDINK